MHDVYSRKRKLDRLPLERVPSVSSSRKSVFKVWDRYYIGRIHVLLSEIKEELQLFMRNI